MHVCLGEVLISGAIVQLLLPSQSLFVSRKTCIITAEMSWQLSKEKKGEKKHNIQQLVFAGRHRPNY